MSMGNVYFYKKKQPTTYLTVLYHRHWTFYHDDKTFSLWLSLFSCLFKLSGFLCVSFPRIVCHPFNPSFPCVCHFIPVFIYCQ